eukprot:917933_1
MAIIFNIHVSCLKQQSRQKQKYKKNVWRLFYMIQYYYTSSFISPISGVLCVLPIGEIRVVPWVLPPVVVLPSVAVLRPSSISSYIFSKSSFSSSSAIITPSPGSRSFGPSSEYVISSSSSPPSISITLLSIAISS